MVNITTTQRHTIKIDREKAKYQLICNFIDLLKDTCKHEEEVGLLEADIHRLTNCLQLIYNNNFKEVFREGFTSMILNTEEFDYVDRFFKEHSQDEEELEIVLVDKEGFTVEVVPHTFLSY